MKLVDFALDPRIFTRKVDFVAELFADHGVCAQRVKGCGYDGGFLLLVVEEGAGGDYHGDNEEGEGSGHLGWHEGWDAGTDVSWACCSGLV